MSTMALDLTKAAMAGDIELVRTLVESGADVNAENAHGAGPLSTVHPEIAAYLLASGADPNVQHDEHGATVLASLAYANRMECVKLLLEHGADANRGREESGETPLHHAIAGGGYIDISALIRLLLQHGADPNAATIPGVISYNFWRDARTRGETPLHRAAAYGSLETIRVLLDAGASRQTRDHNGDSPLSWASWHRRPKNIIDLLTEV